MTETPFEQEENMVVVFPWTMECQMDKHHLVKIPGGAPPLWQSVPPKIIKVHDQHVEYANWWIAKQEVY